MLAVAGYHVDSLYAVDALADTVMARLSVGRNPSALFWSSQSDLVYCANSSSDNVSVIDRFGSTVLKTLGVTDYPFVFAFTPAEGRIYLGHLGSSKVYVIRDTVTGIEEPPQGVPPCVRGRLQVHPTHFAKSVSVVSTSGPGRLLVCSTTGECVAEVMPVMTGPTKTQYVWNGKEEDGAEAPPGVYILAEEGTQLGEGAKVIKVQ